MTHRLLDLVKASMWKILRNAQSPDPLNPGLNGPAGKLPDNAKLECKICWWVYDPQQGDPVWQIAPGIAFADLPPHWRCPQCDGDADQFMVLG